MLLSETRHAKSFLSEEPALHFATSCRIIAPRELGPIVPSVAVAVLLQQLDLDFASCRQHHLARGFTNSAKHSKRSALYDLQGREPSEVFRLLTQPSHHIAAWLLNQVYLALPNPDKSWAGDCQTENFHTRLWEALLLACFREQGLVVTQPYSSPDFCIQNRLGGEAWIEAVTANPSVRYDHVNSQPSSPPEDVRERFLGPAAVRFAKTLGSKSQRRYDRLAHVAGKPFVIALADFHAPASMMWSREALIGYLYGMHAEVIEVDGQRTAASIAASHLVGKAAFRAGLFRTVEHSELSAVVFTNACSIGKFNRVGVSAGALAKGLRYVRLGKFFDRTPGALEGIAFCLDVTSDEYRGLWPQGMSPGRRNSKSFTIRSLNIRFHALCYLRRRIGSTSAARSSAKRTMRPRSSGPKRSSKTIATQCPPWRISSPQPNRTRDGSPTMHEALWVRWAL